VIPCSSCPGRIPEQARFCPACGTPAGSSATPTRLDQSHGAPARGDSARGDEYPLVTLPLTFMTVGVFTLVLRRYGLLAGVVGAYWISLLGSTPLTMDLASWYAAPTLMALVVLGGLAVFGFRVTLAGRPAFRLVAEEAA